MSLHVFLTRLIWLCVLPLLLLAVYLAGNHIHSLQARQDREAANLVRNFVTALDHDIGARIAALQVLAASPLVDDPSRWPDLYREALGFRQSFGGHVVFADLSMQMLFNTRVSFGTPLPKMPVPECFAAAPAVLASGKPAVGDMFFGLIAREPLVAATVPVIRNDQTRALLLSIIGTALLQQRLEAVTLPATWSLTLLDGKDEVMARRPDLERGKGPSAMKDSKRLVVSLAVAPWSVVLEIPGSFSRAPIIAATAALLVAILTVTLFSVLAGRLAGRRLYRAMASLTQRSSPEISRPLITEVEALRTILNDEAAARLTAEQSLRENEQRYRQLFEASPDALFFLDARGHVLDVNRVAEKRYGYSREELLTMSALDLAAVELQQQVGAKVQQAIEAGTQFEWLHRRKDGSEMPVEISACPIIVGKEACVLSSVRDISERKAAEAVLQKSLRLREELEFIINKSPAIVFLWRAAAGWPVEYVSENVRQWGYTPEEFLEGKIVYADLIHQDDQERVAAEVTAFSASGVNEFTQEYRLRTRSGEFLWTDDTTWIRRDDSGSISHYQGIVLDVGERKKNEQELESYRHSLEELVYERTDALEESQHALVNIVEDLSLKSAELEAANARLKELDRLKSMFIASMSHELRTPLNSIIGFSSIILQGMSGDINEEQRDQLGRVARAGKHLLSLITDVIDIAKIESGRISAYAEDFKLQALIDEAVGQVRVQAEDKGLVIEERLPESSLVLHSDRKRLLQCLLNYLSNAVKFSERGTVTVEVKEGESVAEGWVEIRVSDTGIGIREEDMAFLFGPFVRLESPLKIGTPGTGLGLYLTRKLATEVLGGEVSVESREGEGSTFILRIPQQLKMDQESANTV